MWTELVAARIAEPLNPAQDDIEALRQKARDAQGGRPLWDDDPQAMQANRTARRTAAVAMLLKAAAAQTRHSTRRKKDEEKASRR